MLNLNRGILVKGLINKYKFILIFAFIVCLSAFFPLTGDGLKFQMFEPCNLRELTEVSNLGFVSNLMSMILSKGTFLKLIMYGVLATATFMVMRNIVDKKNDALLYVAGFFFLILDKGLFAASFVNLTGFTSYFVGALFLLILLNKVTKNNIFTMRRSVLFVLGLIGTSVEPVYTFVFFTVTLFYLFLEKRDVENKERGIYLLMGEVLGISVMALTQKFVFTGISYNLLHGFIPLVSDSNFIIVLMVSTMILLNSIKIFTRGRRIKITLAMVGVVAFLFSSLLSSSAIVQYITFVTYALGSLYLLLNIRPSVAFNRRIGYYFFFKITYIIISCIFGNIEEGSLLFLSLIDILLLLEFYNGVLPKNFLNNVWLLVFIFIASANIYIYSNTLDKFKEMNVYLKNKLECTRVDYSIPNKYYTEYLWSYVPKNREELEYYIKYHDIEPLGELGDIELHFNR